MEVTLKYRIAEIDDDNTNAVIFRFLVNGWGWIREFDTVEEAAEFLKFYQTGDYTILPVYVVAKK